MGMIAAAHKRSRALSRNTFLFAMREDAAPFPARRYFANLLAPTLSAAGEL